MREPAAERPQQVSAERAAGILWRRVDLKALVPACRERHSSWKTNLNGKGPKYCQLLAKKARGAMARFIVQRPAYRRGAIKDFEISAGIFGSQICHAGKTPYLCVPIPPS